MNYENRYMDMKMISMRWFWYKRCVKQNACVRVYMRTRARDMCMHLCTRICYVTTYTHTHMNPYPTRARVRKISYWYCFFTLILTVNNMYVK